MAPVFMKPVETFFEQDEIFEKLVEQIRNEFNKIQFTDRYEALEKLEAWVSELKKLPR